MPMIATIYARKSTEISVGGVAASSFGRLRSHSKRDTHQVRNQIVPILGRKVTPHLPQASQGESVPMIATIYARKSTDQRKRREKAGAYLR